KVNNTLTKLDLGVNRISEKGGEALAEALKVNNTLTQLDLGYNEITDRGGEALAEALKVNNTLTKLDLGVNRISEKGGEALAEALKRTKYPLEEVKRLKNKQADGIVVFYISDCAKQNGTMPHYTTFNYENILGILNRLTHGTNGNVQQIITHLKFRYV
ncbi:unnamed protein product, partial [Didymodactylos carnosus]